METVANNVKNTFDITNYYLFQKIEEKKKKKTFGV